MSETMQATPEQAAEGKRELSDDQKIEVFFHWLDSAPNREIIRCILDECREGMPLSYAMGEMARWRLGCPLAFHVADGTLYATFRSGGECYERPLPRSWAHLEKHLSGLL